MSESGIGNLILRFFNNVKGWFVHVAGNVFNITINIGRRRRRKRDIDKQQPPPLNDPPELIDPYKHNVGM